MLTIQLTDATGKLDGYDMLKASEMALKAEIAELKHNIQEADTALSLTKDLYEARLADAHATMERAIADQKKEAENAAKADQAQATLAQERAVMAKERELYNQIRQADKENAKLSAQIDQLKAELLQSKAQSAPAD